MTEALRELARKALAGEIAIWWQHWWVWLLMTGLGLLLLTGLAWWLVR